MQSSFSTQTFSNQLISNIFGSVSHEFGTYLNCILTFANMGLNDDDVPESVKQVYFHAMKTNGNLLHYILNNIRDFNQILLN